MRKRLYKSVKTTLPVKVKGLLNGVEMFFKLDHVIENFQILYYLNEFFFDSVCQLKVLIE